MIYIDTSSFFKLFIKEDYSIETGEYTFQQKEMILTTLTILEARSNLRALQMGGKLRKSMAVRSKKTMYQFMTQKPFKVEPFTSSMFDLALSQDDATGVHCRSLDRLHLAAMEELGIRRLMTHDVRQAEAARELGYEVVMPGM